MLLLRLLMIAALVSAPLAQGQQQATPVGVDIVSHEPMLQTIPVIGRLVSLQSGVVAARTSGPVADIKVEVGDHVAEGDVIAVLDQARLRAQLDLVTTELDEMRARLATAEANQAMAQQELGRFERLRNTAAFNKALLDDQVQKLEAVRSNRKEAEARIARGKVAQRLAEIELADATIRAPFPGAVILRHVSEGAWLQVGSPVITLLNDNNLEVEADVPADRLAGLSSDAEVALLFNDGSLHQARVRAIIPDENPAARTRPVRFLPVFGVLQNALANNQTVTLLIPTGTQGEVISVNKDAVLRKGGQALVYVVEDGVAKPRSVQLGEAVGSRFRVLDGLAPGEVVVIRGNERLQPGQSVSYPGQTDHAQASAEQG